MKSTRIGKPTKKNTQADNEIKSLKCHDKLKHWVTRSPKRKLRSQPLNESFKVKWSVFRPFRTSLFTKPPSACRPRHQSAEFRMSKQIQCIRGEARRLIHWKQWKICKLQTCWGGGGGIVCCSMWSLAVSSPQASHHWSTHKQLGAMRIAGWGISLNRSWLVSLFSQPASENGDFRTRLVYTS